jgi:hypothetical protein
MVRIWAVSKTEFPVVWVEENGKRHKGVIQKYGKGRNSHKVRIYFNATHTQAWYPQDHPDIYLRATGPLRQTTPTPTPTQTPKATTTNAPQTTTTTPTPDGTFRVPRRPGTQPLPNKETKATKPRTTGKARAILRDVAEKQEATQRRLEKIAQRQREAIANRERMLLYEESEHTTFDLDAMTAEGQASILALLASRGVRQPGTLTTPETKAKRTAPPTPPPETKEKRTAPPTPPPPETKAKRTPPPTPPPPETQANRATPPAAPLTTPPPGHSFFTL